MSEERRPDEIIIIKLPKNKGKKQGETRKYELFSAVQFARRWSPMEDNFYPKPPLQSVERVQFWKGYYRVRIDGKWLSDQKKYTLFKRADISAMINFVMFNLS